MWILECEKNGKKYCLLAKKEYLVGRKEADILIAEDPSISRKHAVLQISHSEVNLSNPEKLPVVLLNDNGSKYGTFVNGKQVKVETMLKEGDVLTFGQLGSNFKLLFEPLVVTTSSLSMATKTELRSALLSLGGHLLSEWRANCTHLVMNEIKVTIKAVCAMVSLKPMVLPSYFTDLLERCNSAKNLPLLKDYLPPLGEDSLMQEYVGFDIVPARATLFKNKTFIFFSKKQYKKLHVAISAAGGQAEVFDTDEPIPEKILHKDTCVVESEMESPSLQTFVSAVEEKLGKVHRRTIPESDIGLAVVYCSLAKFCNPNARTDFMQISQIPSQTLSQDIFVPETQTVNHPPTVDNWLSSQTSVAETVFCTEREDHQWSDDDSTLEADDSTRKRFRELSSDEQRDIPSCKQPRVGKESIVFASVSIKAEKTAEEDMIDWDNIYTQPLPTTITQTFSQIAESQALRRNDGKMIEKRSDFENADTQPLPSSLSEIRDSFATQPTNKGDGSGFDVKMNIVPFGFQPSKKKTHSSIKHNISVPSLQDCFESDLPAKLMKVAFQPLVRKPLAPIVSEPSTTSRTMKNFKKFQKVHSTGFCLPRIIGGKDMEVFQQRIGARELQNWLNEEDDFDDLGNIFSNHHQNKKAKRR